MVARSRLSARRRGTVSSHEFSNPSGASQTMFQRARNSRRTRVIVVAAEPAAFFAEDRHQAGAGVLGIEVDRSGAQRLEAEVGAGETEPALDLEAVARLDRLCEQLAEKAALLEVLRADDDRLRGGQRRRRAGVRQLPRRRDRLLHIDHSERHRS